MAVPLSSPFRPWASRVSVALGALLVTVTAALGGGHGVLAPAPAAADATTTTTTPHAQGPVPAYWLVASDGGVFAFGGMAFAGSMGGKPLDKPMVGMAGTHDAKGYWTVATDGGIFSFGDAVFHGSMGGKPLDKPVVAMAATPDGGGYWLVASDGGIFSFGDAVFHGSMGGKPLTQPIVGMAAADAGGYWMVASDGGIFTFGDATYQGSLGGHALSRPIIAMAGADRGGYWTTDTNGAVTAFGDGGYWGSAPQQLAAPVVGMADGPGTGQSSGNGIYPSGSYGYDLSNFQCGASFPSGHTIGVIQTNGWPQQAPNPCLAQEGQWAGAGLNLYTFLAYGTSASAQPGCNNDQACNFGYLSATFAFGYAQSQGVNTAVTWWLDVENSAYWSASTAENAQVVQGALNSLRDKGINNVGVYFSPDNWNQIVGNYRPGVPIWVAWYQDPPSGPANCQDLAAHAASAGDQLPTGPMWLTQYSADAATQSNGQPVDGDYAC